MKRIISQNIHNQLDDDEDFPQPNDFTDVGARRLDGSVAEALSLLTQATEKLTEIRTTNPRITLQELMADADIAFLIKQSHYMISGYVNGV